MKPAAFDYYRPAMIDDAVAALGSSDSAKVLAGGQSLIPAMNFRLSLPDLLVDIRSVEGLGDIAAGHDGVTIGAAVTQSRVMNSDDVAGLVPGLRRALHHVGHLQIRNQGTVCGSLAYGDPAAELPALALATGAEMTVRGADGTRTVHADDFYLGPYWTALEPAEIVTSVRFPAQAPDVVTIVDEVSRRSGDFAIVGLAAVLQVRDGAIGGGRLVSFGVSGRAQRLETAEEAIRGFAPDDGGEELYDAVYGDAADALDDIHADIEYRREALAALVVRAARTAVTSNGDRTGV